MQVKNISARPHHVGGVLIAPGATETIPAEWANSINKAELVAVATDDGDDTPVQEAKRGRKKAAE